MLTILHILPDPAHPVTFLLGFCLPWSDAPAHPVQVGTWVNMISCPFLTALHKKGFLNFVDYALAETLLKSPNGFSEAAAAFICHLSTATREGHLSTSVSDKIMPSPSIWRNADNQEIPYEELTALTQLILKGVQELPATLVTDLAVENTVKPIYRNRNHYYFQRYWQYEKEVVEHIFRLENASPLIEINKQKIEEATSKLSLLPEQSQAIISATTHQVMILCGGPGTGKTYTAGQMIRLFWTSLDETARHKCEIALAAPTGKAATNLQNSLQYAVKDLIDFPQIQAKTIHSLLGLRSDGSYSEEFEHNRLLKANILLIDESSMLDIQLMSKLLAAIKNGTRVIFLGDHRQLPPIAPGAPFNDLLKHYKSKNTGQAVELKKCLRAELSSILELAEMIDCGQSDKVIEMASMDLPGIGYTPCIADRNAQKSLLEYALPFFYDLNGAEKDNLVLLRNANRFRILSPVRQGWLGVDTLNQIIVKRLLELRGNNNVFIAPIMIAANDYRMNLFNGDVGILIKKLTSSYDTDLSPKEGDYALFAGRQVPAVLLPRYEYAYCLSVHKSQGSEFDHVLLLMCEGAERFGREVLYTAVTRARKKLEIWGETEVIKKTIKQHSQRHSGIMQRLEHRSAAKIPQT